MRFYIHILRDSRLRNSRDSESIKKFERTAKVTHTQEYTRALDSMIYETGNALRNTYLAKVHDATPNRLRDCKLRDWNVPE